MQKTAKSTIHRLHDALDSLEPSADKLVRDLSSEVRSLRREVEALSSHVGSQGGHLFHDLGDEAGELAKYARKYGGRAVRQLRHSAEDAGGIVRENPVPLLAAAAVIGLLVVWAARRD